MSGVLDPPIPLCLVVRIIVITSLYAEQPFAAKSAPHHCHYYFLFKAYFLNSFTSNQRTVVSFAHNNSHYMQGQRLVNSNNENNNTKQISIVKSTNTNNQQGKKNDALTDHVVLTIIMKYDKEKIILTVTNKVHTHK